MKINFYILINILIIVIISSKTLQSKNLGDLTKQKPIEMNVQLNGKIGEMHFFSPNILIFETGKLYKLKIINNEDELNSLVNGSKLLTAYPSIGYEKDKLSELKKQNKINLKYLYDSYDLLCWPHAKSGFFKFKNKISDFIKAI